ncbi:MAG: 3-keto-5-aminohexanoate cleavage protein [Actinobacteria bacterium]|nr:3-keto-5-aminohexanoate cleavage protein [Actinomycetota bacterium]
MASNKYIITAAITGAVHTTSMSPFLPITPEQIADEAVASYEAGAAVAHIHVRDPQTGAPSREVTYYKEVAQSVKAKCDMILCMTTGAGIGATVEERLRSVIDLSPELATFSYGSMNFGLYPMAEGFKGEFKFDWEEPYLRNTESFVFENSFAMLKEFNRIFAEHQTVGELEIYDTGMIYNVAFMKKRGDLKDPIYMQWVLGILGGIGATFENLQFMYSTARNLVGDFNWSVCAGGRLQMPLCTLAMNMGGNVRVGLEDSLLLSKGVLAKSNAEQVEKIARIGREFDLEPATPEEARAILGLKGLDKVNW